MGLQTNLIRQKDDVLQEGRCKIKTKSLLHSYTKEHFKTRTCTLLKSDKKKLTIYPIFRAVQNKNVSLKP